MTVNFSTFVVLDVVQILKCPFEDMGWILRDNDCLYYVYQLKFLTWKNRQLLSVDSFKKIQISGIEKLYKENL